jgi:hypothetical protein
MPFDPNTAQLIEQPQKSKFDPSTAKLVSDDSDKTLDVYPKSIREKIEKFFTENVPENAGKVASGFGQLITHPIKTAKGMGELALGEIEKVSPAVNIAKSMGIIKQPLPQENLATQVNKDLGNKYGSPKKILASMYNNPIETAIDISMLVGGAGGAMEAVGEGGKLAEVGRMASKASEVINPVSQAGKLASGVAKLLGKGIGRVTGEGLGITTGAGYGAIKEAFENPTEAYTKALRGETSGEDVVNAAKESLSAIKQSRHDEYTQRLETLKQVKEQLDVSPIHKEISNQLERFNISVKEDGTLDFGRSAIRFDKKAQGDINNIYEEMKKFGTVKGDRTVIGVDSLKRSFQDLYSESSNVRAFVQAVSKKTREVLSGVKGYDEMAADYSKKTQQIDEITKGLSLGNKVSVDTSIRKMTSIFRQNNEFRKDLLEQLEQVGGKDLSGMVAGYQLNPITPRGLFGKFEEIGGGIKILSNPSMILHPQIIAAMAAASPRVMGEFLRGIGLTKIQASNFLDYIKQTPVGKIIKPKIGSILTAGYYGGRFTS